MAIYRNVHISFWSDAKVSEEMTPEDKYFMLYLLTNQHSTQIGCYSITKKQMAYELGYNVETVEKLLARLENNLNIINYDHDTKEILILNWYKYNWTTSPKIFNYINKELKNIKSLKFREILKKYITYIYGIDTLGIQKEKEKEQEEEQEKEKQNDEKFEIFWNKYPRKASKVNARKAFFKANFSDVVFNKMLNALDVFVKSSDWKKQNGMFIPYPATWLNQRRWEDENINIKTSEIPKTEIDPELEKRFAREVGEIYGRN